MTKEEIIDKNNDNEFNSDNYDNITKEYTNEIINKTVNLFQVLSSKNGTIEEAKTDGFEYTTEEDSFTTGMDGFDDKEATTIRTR